MESGLLLVDINGSKDEKTKQTGSPGEEDILRNVEMFVEENESERRLQFYKAPRLMQFWEEEQEELESWKELFYDLIYVAVAFQLGIVLEELILDDDYGSFFSGFFFFGQFLPLFSHWYTRVMYLSRFSTNSYFHAVLDIIYALLIAMMAVFISKRSVIEETIGGFDETPVTVNRTLAEVDEVITFNEPLAFAITGILATFVHLFRSFELIFVASKHGVREDTDEDLRRRQSKAIVVQGWSILARTCGTLLFMFLSLVGAYSGSVNLFLIPLIFSFFAMVAFQIGFTAMLTCIFGFAPKNIPINVGFVLKRCGEFTMLMLGEGVLQIIIAPIQSEDLDGDFETLVLSFIVLSCIYYLAFSALTYEPEEHAFRKSRFAGLAYACMMPFTFASIMAVGVCLKLILKKQGELTENDIIIRSFSTFLTNTVFTIFLCRLFNHGYHEITKRDASEIGRLDKSWDNVHFFRICVSALLILSSFIFVTLRGVSLDGSPFLGVVIAMFAVIFAIALLERKLFEKEEEVNERDLIVSGELREQYAKQTKMLSGEGALYKSGRVGDITVVNILQFLRQRTRMIEGKVREAADPNKIYDWEADVKEVEKLALLIRETFQTAEVPEIPEDESKLVGSQQKEDQTL